MRAKFLMIMFSLVVSVLYAQTTTERTVTWDYPVKPGSEEWKSFKTGQQMREACMIPQDVLKALTSRDLAWICFNYPLFVDFGVSNDERRSIDFMIERFNGLQELSKRKDGTRELINLYRSLPVFDGQHDVSPYHQLTKLPFVELLLADKSFVNQLDEKMAGELLKIVLSKYESKVEHSDVYSLWNIKKTFLLGAVVLEKHGITAKPPDDQETIKRFIANYLNPDPVLITEMSKIISAL